MVRRLLILGALATALLPQQIGCRTASVEPAFSRGGSVPMATAVTLPGQFEPQPPLETPLGVPAAVQPVSLVKMVEEELPSPSCPDREEFELTLIDAIKHALDANPDLESASEQLAIADAGLARARAEFYPTLGVSEQYGVSNNPVSAFMFQLNQRQLNPMQDFNHPPTTNDFHTQLRLQHNLYSGKRRIHEMHAACANSAAAALSLSALQNQLVFRVAEAYYHVLQARDLVEVRREAVAQVEEHLKIVETRYRNDTAVTSDVLTVKVRLAEVREAFLVSQNQWELAWAVLENVVGAPFATRAIPDSIPTAPWSDHVDQIESAIAVALGQRTEIGALANRRRAAVEGVLVAEAGKRVTVDVVADYDVFTGDFRQGADSFFAGVIVQLKLFDGGRTRTEVARVTARVRELQARQRRLMLDIELDVRRAYLQLQDAETRLDVTMQAIDLSRESLREIEVRYRNQTASITQLIDAQVALSSTRVRNTSAEADVQIARASLQRAMGQLDELVCQ